MKRRPGRLLLLAGVLLLAFGFLRGEMASALAARPFHAGNEYYVGGQLLIDLWDEYDDPVELAKEAARRVNTYLELSRSARAPRREAALL